MSAMANTTSIVTTVTKTATKEKTLNGFCEEHYEDILPVIDKICRDKRKEVHTRLDFGENSRKSQRMRKDSQNSSAKTLFARYRNPSKRPQIRDRLRNNDGNVFGRLGQTGNTLEMIPTVEVVLTNRNLLLAEIVLEAKTAPTASKNRMRRMTLEVKVKKAQATDEDDLAVPWSCEKVKRWAMPTWCHMFNSTIIGTARVWFNELPPESIDGYKDLKASFLAYFMQQKKYVKDPVKIHNIKQKDGETIEDFMERFKTVEEMMNATTAFIRGETAAASKKKVSTPWKSQDQSKRQNSEGRSDFRNQPKDGQGYNKFTPLTRTPKEIFAAKSGKFKPTSPMVTPVEKRSSNKFCEFHNDKGHSTDECVQLRKQIEKLVRAGKLSYFIKEIRRDRDQQKTGKKDDPIKDKATAINMIHPLQRVARQKPLGQLRLLVTIGNAGNYTRAWMNFMIVRSPSPYNGIIGRHGIREIQAVPSTAHGMLKFSVNGRIVTIRSTILTPTECTTIVETPKDHAKKAEARYKIFKVAIHLDFPDQEITIGGTVSTKAQTKLCTLLKKILDIFAWIVTPFQKSIGRSNPSAATPLSVSWTPTKAIIKYRWPNEMRKRRLSTLGMGRMNVSRIHDQSGSDKIVPRQDGGRVTAPIPTNNQRDAEQAFKQLKLPMLVASKPKEELIIYLFASYGAISTVLMTERDTVQTPVYFVSRALQAPELNYTPMENLVLALVCAAKRLRGYFQSVMLGEHNITYRPRTFVKGQILADFLDEKSDDTPPEALVIETPQDP
nr:reverse transcriptase domain-containing protein [Tanacetum cinerariifolium]